jgi:hypothetical protein
MNNAYALKTSENVNKRAVLALVSSTFGIALILFALGVGESAEPNSADEILLLTSGKQCAEFTDTDLDLWKSRGVDGFICSIAWLRPFGGAQNYTGEWSANLSGSDYEIQRKFRDSNTVARAKAKGISMYLGFYLTSYWNTATPLNDWFDDSKWQSEAIPGIRDLAAAAKLLGFAGLSYDSELYGQTGNASTATWEWNYPGNARTESQVRAKVKERGQQVMQTILSVFPNVEIIAYNSYLPEAGDDIVQTIVNNTSGSTFKNYTHIDFIDGLTSVNGYSAFNLSTETFYKECYYSWLPCDKVLEEHTNKLYSLLSRRLSNWEYASERFFQPSFIWIDGVPGSTGWSAPRSAEHVATQLDAYTQWGNGRKLLIYANQGLTFDYNPYVSSIQEASQPTVVDTISPTLIITSPNVSGQYQTSLNKLSLSGYAKDNFAIQAVRWSNDRGGSGAAQMNWEVFSNYTHASYADYYQNSWEWQTNWSIADITLQSGLNKITLVVEDIKGLKTTQPLNITLTSTSTPTPPQPPVPPPSDTTVPSVPSNLSASALSTSQISLSWNASTDNLGVTGYRVEQCQESACPNFTQIGMPSGTTFQNNGLSADTAYRYRVRATDAAGNLSAYSAIVSATTQGGTPPPESKSKCKKYSFAWLSSSCAERNSYRGRK